MAKRIATIGDRWDYNAGGVFVNGDYPATTSGILSALNAGYRWLLIQDYLIDCTSTINLDMFDPPYSLRIDGGAVDGAASPADGRTVFRKNTSLAGPVLQCINSPWQVLIRGVTFDGNYPAGTDYPLIDLGNIRNSRFDDCAFISNRWDGASVGVNSTTGNAENSLFINCVFKDNQRNGLNVDKAVKVDVINCYFADNGRAGGVTEWAGLFYQGPASGFPLYAERGLSNVRQCFFEESFNSLALSAWFIRSRSIAFANNYVRQRPVRFWYDTDHCRASNNLMVNGAGWDNRGINNSVTNNEVIP